MNSKVKTFDILPVFSISRVTNTLTKEARKSFDVNWNHYYVISMGWLFWTINFQL